MAHFVWYLDREKRYGIETLSFARVLNKEHLYGKCAPKASPRPPFYFGKQPKTAIAWRVIICWKNKNLIKK